MIFLWILVALLCVLAIIFLLFRYNLRRIRKMFNYSSVSVCGLRGRGKDMLIANVIARNKRPYISNVDYRCKHSQFLPLDMSKLDVKNNYRDFIYGSVREYRYPYPQGADIYISDVGVYFPAQYNGELNKEFKQFPVFMALSRQIGQCNVHVNSQALNRPWDKLREQCDQYILCNKCVYFGKNRFFARIPFLNRLVYQVVTVYDRYQAACDAVFPYEHIKAPVSLSGKVRAEYKARDRLAVREFRERNGLVRRYRLLYFNKSNYDTRFMYTLIKGGVKSEKAF